MATILFRPSQKGLNLKQENISAILSTKFNRQHLSEETEKSIDSIWELKKLEKPHLWNGTKFRLSTTTESCESHITFELGITDYKDFLGTNYSEKSKELQERGIRDHANDASYLAQPLGVGSVVVTGDDMIVFILRSEFCAEATGLYDIPGGHPEPKEIFGDLRKEEINGVMSNVDPKSVVCELFKSSSSEVSDEVNIPPKSLGEPVLLGVAGNKGSANRPVAEFHIRCNLTSTEIQHLYSSGTQKEAEESTNILFFPVNKLADIENNTLWEELTDSAKGALVLFRWHSQNDK